MKNASSLVDARSCENPTWYYYCGFVITVYMALGSARLRASLSHYSPLRYFFILYALFLWEVDHDRKKISGRVLHGCDFVGGKIRAAISRI